MNAPTESPTKRTRAVDVQVPGAAPAAHEQERAPVEVIKERVAELLDEKAAEAAPVPASGRGAYRKMRAVDVDHTKLTAPVLTLDGWVCPPAPTAKV